MKKIIFMLINMNVGGTEKALLNMLAEIPKDKYDITILLLEEYGEFLEHIPQEIHVLYFQAYENIKELLNKSPYINSFNLCKKKRYITAFKILFLHLVFKITNNRNHFFKYILKNYSVFNNDYDVAVAYAGPMDFITYYVLNNMKARKKIQWIHFDVTKIGFNKKFAAKMYGKFDKVFVVSNEGKDKLLNMLPNIKEKIQVFSNIISSKLVTEMAEEGNGFQDDFDGVRILTVGRLSKEKGQDLTIPVLAKLKQEGYKVRWYCIGEGGSRKEYEQLIQSFKVEPDYILLGSNSNPYPFMKQCGIYIQSSRHEGYCITLAEARCFNSPIISTNFTGAREQIIHKKTGLIVECDEQQIYNAVKRLLDDEKLRNMISENLECEIVDTTKEIEKLYKVAEDIDHPNDRRVCNEKDIIYG
jgi:glycosyltransferase involved in cell wall biosynthesis